MSRDAKVGLIIVFVFVFLLGTIMVHRMHGNSAAQTALSDAGDADVAPEVEEGELNTADLSQASVASSLTASQMPIEAKPADELDPAPSGNIFRPQPPSPVNATARSTQPFATPRGGSDATPATDRGAHISFTDSDDDRQPAAIIEPRAAAGATTKRQDDIETTPSGGSDAPETGSVFSRRSPPTLSIGSRPEAANENADERSTRTNQAESEPQRPANETKETIEPPSDARQEMLAGRGVPQLDTPPSAGILPGTDESDSPASGIQPAAGNRRPESKEPPSRLPQFADVPQPKIEAVPDRGSRAAPAAVDRHTPSASADPIRTGPTPPATNFAPMPTQNLSERTYTVKERDSFWSISAKHYGTGKHFRALEEYNRDRVKLDERGQTMLKPGMVIVLPDVSILKQRPAPKAPIPTVREPATSLREPATSARDSTPATSRDTRPATRPSHPLASPPSSPPSAVSRSGNTAGLTVHRVEEGDTLTSVAQRRLGSAKRWDEIYRLNKDRITDPNHLKVGTELKLPAAPAENPADTAGGRR